MLPAARRPGAGEQPAGRMRESANGVDPRLVERVRSALAAEPGVPSPARVTAALRSEGTVLGDSAVLEVTELLRAEIAGAGPLDALLREPGVTDVLVNAPDTVWVDRGHGLERSPVRLRDEAAVRRLAQRLAAAAGRRLDEAMPYVDARLPGGIRLHAVLPPISPYGTLVALVRARLAFFVTGGTGSGKTTPRL